MEDKKKFTILYIDDEEQNLEVFKSAFRHTYTIITAQSPREGLYKLRLTPIHLVISDYKMPEQDGIEFLEQIASEFPQIYRIILTAFGDKEVMLGSINRANVIAFVNKPWRKQDFAKVIEMVYEKFKIDSTHIEFVDSLVSTNNELKTINSQIGEVNVKLEQENSYLKREIETDRYPMIGDSIIMKSVLDQITQVARLPTTVLILGETGTGKELVARAIHRQSSRSNKTFIKLNCAALPFNLVESELFGHERGAFTGAVGVKIGMFETASGGTLFLDEVGELPLDIQAKLLRVLQDQEFFRVGSNKPTKVDVRIIAATNRNLADEIVNGSFRADLYFRLSVFPIKIPPLRERMDDIPQFVEHFVSMHQRRLGIQINEIPKSIYNTLLNYDWPGNIRELESLIERSMIMCTDGVLAVSDWLSPIATAPVKNEPRIEHGTLSSNEKEHIITTLNKTNWKIAGKGGAAEVLQIHPNTLRSKMERFGINWKARK